MKSGDATISDDRQGRPAQATGLPSHRAPIRQVQPRRRGTPLWRSVRRHLGWLALGAIVVVALAYVVYANAIETAQPLAPAEPTVAVAEATPLVEVPTSVVAPVVASAPVDTPVPTSIPAPLIVPTVVTPAATATQAAATVTAVRAPTGTPVSASSQGWIGNTGGSGVYVRKTPAAADRLRAYPDGTQLTVIGEDVTGDGQQWKHVRTPDGVEGYVPAAYVLDKAP
jgi:hypothetical protein